MNEGIQKNPTHNITFMLPFVLKTPVKAPKEKSGWHKVPKSGNGENEFELRYFFTPEARELLFDAQNKQKGQAFYALPENGAYYRIKKNEAEYVVAAKYIHMMRLDNGVGLLTLKTEIEESEKLEIITQLGRKIYPTSLCENDEETADSLELLGTNVKFEVWRKELRKHEKEEEPEERRRKKLHPDADFIAAPFLELIKKFSGERNTVTPILGDKMFVSHTHDCIDETDVWERKRPAYTDGTVQLDWYDYVAMVVLLQRATIEDFFIRSRTLSIELNNSLSKMKIVSRNCRKKVEKLYSDYVKARNALFLHQLTIHKEGIEEYIELRREWGIEAHLEDLDDKIKNLCELSRIRGEQKENKMLSAIAVFGLPLALVPMLWEVKGWFAPLAAVSDQLYGQLTLGIGVLVLLALWIWHEF